MKDFSTLKHRYFNTPSKRISVLSIVLIALSVFIVASLIGEQNLDIRGQAKKRVEQAFASGCYYKLPCPVKNSGSKPLFDCQPILVCPKPTSPKLTCEQCLENKQQQLCFDPTAKVSYCMGREVVVDSGISCVSCEENAPTPSCIPRPRCVDNPPYCLLPEPIGGWCRTTPTPELCLQVFTPARNKLTGECKLFPTSCLPDGWVADKTCAAKPTSQVCPTPPPCRGTLIYGDPVPKDINKCPRYACIESTPSTKSITPLPQQ